MSGKRKLLKIGPVRALWRFKNNAKWIYQVLTQREARNRSNLADAGSLQQEFSFVPYEGMVGDVRRWCAALPRSFDAVLAIPRSGVIPAAMVALHFDCPLGDVGHFIRHRSFFTGGARTTKREQRPVKKILVIDDSCRTGSNLKKVREELDAIPGYEFLFGAVYSTKEAAQHLDFFYREVFEPRAFEWNILHHDYFLPRACCDIDGVLCLDPTEEQNDDGSEYLKFLAEATPLHVPTVEVHTLVTSRLEKYRAETEAWLKKHGIRYKRLVMAHYASKAERQAANAHARLKADVYLESGCELFVESELRVAEEIFSVTHKPVLCVSNMMLLSRYI